MKQINVNVEMVDVEGAKIIDNPANNKPVTSGWCLRNVLDKTKMQADDLKLLELVNLFGECEKKNQPAKIDQADFQTVLDAVKQDTSLPFRTLRGQLVKVLLTAPDAE